MLQVALSQLKTHSRRFIAITLAVLLAVAFLSATLMVNASTNASLGASIGQAYAAADLVISPTYEEPLSPEAVDKVAADPSVAASYGLSSIAVSTQLERANVGATLRNMPQSANLEPLALDSGAWPVTDREVTVDHVTARKNALIIGSQVTLAEIPGSSGTSTTPGPSISATISGITAASADPSQSGVAQFVGSTTAVKALAGTENTLSVITLRLKDGVSTTEAKSSLAKALNLPIEQILTPAEQTTQDVASFTGGQDQLTIVLLAFAAVALLVSALVVSNTFSVLVAQRTRELALLRCVGASRTQVRNSVILEALVVGFTASVLGVLAAIGTMAAVLAFLRTNADFAFATLAVPASAIVAGIVVGTLLTVLAALVPARAATAVAPLAALRPSDDLTLHNTGGRVRLSIGVALILMGGVGLVYGGLSSQLLIALPAGAASFVGLLMAATLFVPKLVSLAGKLASPAGVPGKMAAANAVRNPRRTTATASALLIGVTLVTMMMTGAATARNAFETQLNGHYPVDISAQTQSGAPAITAADVAKASALPGVKAAALLQLVGTVNYDSTSTPVYGISDADAAKVLVNPANRPSHSTVVMPKGYGVRTVNLTVGTKTTTVSTVEATSDSFTALVSLDTFPALASTDSALNAPSIEVWFAVNPELDTSQLMDLRAELAKTLHIDEFMVSGAAVEKATFNQVINMLLLVVTGLLAIAVFIALIGVANTLSLSVLERTRENSLLRALGLTRGQLRGMLALEAVLIAGVAAVIGSTLGVLYGWLGAQSALGSFTTVTAIIPWGQILLVVLVAAVAGLLASVIPARRAANLSPVAGLAMD